MSTLNTLEAQSDRRMSRSNDYEMATPTLLGLPRELRLIILEHLVECEDVISIYAHTKLTRAINQEIIGLSRVWPSICMEVQEIYFRKQIFHFRSPEAIKRFCKVVRPDHLRLIKHIELGPGLHRRTTSAFEQDVCDSIRNHLIGVERITIKNPTWSFLGMFIRHDGNGHRHVADDKVIALRGCSPKLASANVYFQYTRPWKGDSLYMGFDGLESPTLQFMPKDCKIEPREVGLLGVRFSDLVDHKR